MRMYGGVPLKPNLLFGWGFCSDDTEHTLWLAGRSRFREAIPSSLNLNWPPSFGDGCCDAGRRWIRYVTSLPQAARWIWTAAPWRIECRQRPLDRHSRAYVPKRGATRSPRASFDTNNTHRLASGEAALIVARGHARCSRGHQYPGRIHSGYRHAHPRRRLAKNLQAAGSALAENKSCLEFAEARLDERRQRFC